MAQSKRNMLPPKEGEKFFHLFLPLLAYVDKDRPFIFGDSGDMGVRAMTLWKDPTQIDSFIRDMDLKKAGWNFTLSKEDREILRSWKRFRRDIYYLASHQVDGSLLVNQSFTEVYKVLGLQSSLQEMAPKTPIMVMTTILPWKDKLITDGLLIPIQISNPGGLRAKLNTVCNSALANGTVITNI